MKELLPWKVSAPSVGPITSCLGSAPGTTTPEVCINRCLSSGVSLRYDMSRIGAIEATGDTYPMFEDSLLRRNRTNTGTRPSLQNLLRCGLVTTL